MYEIGKTEDNPDTEGLAFLIHPKITDCITDSSGSNSSNGKQLLSTLACLLAGCLTSQQQASVSQGRICSDNFTCCHTEIDCRSNVLPHPVTVC